MKNIFTKALEDFKTKFPDYTTDELLTFKIGWESAMEHQMANLRVAVVPTETGNGINQSSDVEEILNCEETQLFSITDYFKAQNDDEFGLHWSFLIDIEAKLDLTGTNIKGIHYF